MVDHVLHGFRRDVYMHPLIASGRAHTNFRTLLAIFFIRHFGDRIGKTRTRPDGQWSRSLCRKL